MNQENKEEIQDKAKLGTSEFVALQQVIAALQSLGDEHRIWVVRSALDYFKPNSATQIFTTTVGTTSNVQNETPKQFLRTKKPQSEVERVACLAYFLNHVRGEMHFKAGDIDKLNLEAAGDPFKNLPKTMGNAIYGSGFLAPVGGGKRQLTAYGEDVVNALPDRVKVRALTEAKPKRRYSKKKNKPGAE